jgi:hypothetical protein
MHQPSTGNISASDFLVHVGFFESKTGTKLLFSVTAVISLESPS